MVASSTSITAHTTSEGAMDASTAIAPIRLTRCAATEPKGRLVEATSLKKRPATASAHAMSSIDSLRASDVSWINAFFITDASFTVGRE